MKRLLLILLLLLAIPAQAVPPVDKNWAKTWGDDFNTLDGSKWTTWGLPWGALSNGANGELQTYDSGSTTVKDGYLTLTATRNGNGYKSGIAHTFNKVSVQPGSYVEFRAKFPPGKGMWGAGWLLEQNPAFPWPGTGFGEVDITEILGNQKTINNVNYHFMQNGAYGNSPNPYNTGVDLTNGFYTYGAYIKPDGVDYYFENKKIHSVSGKSITKPGYILFNLATGGNWPGAPDASTPFPGKMLVDYVYVYQEAAGPVTPPPASQAINFSCSGTTVDGKLNFSCSGSQK